MEVIIVLFILFFVIAPYLFAILNSFVSVDDFQSKKELFISIINPYKAIYKNIKNWFKKFNQLP